MSPQDRLTPARLRATSDPHALAVADEDGRRGVPAYTHDEHDPADPRAVVVRCPTCGERFWDRGFRHRLYCRPACCEAAYERRRRAAKVAA